MTETELQLIGQSRGGFIIAPAGCGKTEAIVKSVERFTAGTQLILTHTHAGVSALKRRFRDKGVDKNKYHIDTISGWALKWVSRYPITCGYTGSLPIPRNQDWSSLYNCASGLLSFDWVLWVIKNSYTGVFVDEYQDCTRDMHIMIKKLSTILSTRVFGDPLQAIFDFNNESLIPWSSVEDTFMLKLAELTIPYRWVNSGNDELGNWLIDIRVEVERGQTPSFSNSPVRTIRTTPQSRAGDLIRLIRSLSGSMCVIGPKDGNWHAALTTTLVSQGFEWIEPNELPKVRSVIEVIQNSSPENTNTTINGILRFIESSFGSINKHSPFLMKLMKGENQNPRLENKKFICRKWSGQSVDLEMILDILDFCEDNGRIKRRESVGCLRKVISDKIYKGDNLLDLLSNEIQRRKVIGRTQSYRCFGSTLLLKGLEFNHSIVLFDPNRMAVKDLYVALTRGSNSVNVITT